jgi:hypothetical protein
MTNYDEVILRRGQGARVIKFAEAAAPSFELPKRFSLGWLDPRPLEIASLPACLSPASCLTDAWSSVKTSA